MKKLLLLASLLLFFVGSFSLTSSRAQSGCGCPTLYYVESINDCALSGSFVCAVIRPEEIQ